jgi:hypothetical protein
MNTENMTEFCLMICEDTIPLLIEDHEVNRLREVYMNVLLGHQKYFFFSAYNKECQQINFIIPRKLILKSMLTIKVKPE